MEINKWIIEDVAWTLRQFFRDFKECEEINSNEAEILFNKAAHAALINAKHKCGMCMTYENFYDSVFFGGLIDYDGFGYFVDNEGNKIKDVYCDCDWLNENRPENCNFVMWYNK
jgi:hypothetical protein